MATINLVPKLVYERRGSEPRPDHINSRKIERRLLTPSWSTPSFTDSFLQSYPISQGNVPRFHLRQPSFPRHERGVNQKYPLRGAERPSWDFPDGNAICACQPSPLCPTEQPQLDANHSVVENPLWREETHLRAFRTASTIQ